MIRVLISFLCFIAIAHADNANPDPVAVILPKLESLIQKSMRQKKIPGIAVAVVSNGKVIYKKGFGVRNLGHPAPVDQETLFQIGSTSKAITSTLIAVLKREQALNLDHPIEFLPGVTLRHVLSHTTGISSAGFNALIERGDTPQEVLEKLKEITIEDPPGTKFSYHNVVYNLSTGVIEEQMGASFESILQTKLLQPLKMTKTNSTWAAFISQENRASPHVLKGIKGKEKGKGKGKKKTKIINKSMHQAPYRKEYTNFPAAGGFSSSIQDMSLFLAAIMGSRPDVLSPQDLEDFIRPIIHTPDQWKRTHKHRDRISKTQYGLGWRHMIFADRPVVFHGGWIRGFSTILAFLPEENVGIVIMQNAESSLAFNISMQFFDWVLGLPKKEWVK
jgi:beta-lactamase class C